MKRSIILILVAFASVSSTWAKNVDTYGATTFFSLAAKVSKYGTLNFYHYDVFNFSRRALSGKEFRQGAQRAYFQTYYSYQLRPDIVVAAGYIYQRSNPFEDEFENEQRVFQQITYGVSFRSFTMSHRVRVEERFFDNRETHGFDFGTRVRYQIGAKIPLRGLSLDAREFYLRTYNEFYFPTTGERNAFFNDDWLYAGLGYKTQGYGSFEMGPLLQWSRINEDKDTRTHYTIQLGWLVSF